MIMTHCTFVWSNKLLKSMSVVQLNLLSMDTLIILQQAITTPSMAVSHIMLESYKKFILVALILHGKVRGKILDWSKWWWRKNKKYVYDKNAHSNKNKHIECLLWIKNLEDRTWF